MGEVTIGDLYSLEQVEKEKGELSLKFGRTALILKPLIDPPVKETINGRAAEVVYHTYLIVTHDANFPRVGLRLKARINGRETVTSTELLDQIKERLAHPPPPEVQKREGYKADPKDRLRREFRWENSRAGMFAASYLQLNQRYEYNPGANRMELAPDPNSYINLVTIEGKDKILSRFSKDIASLGPGQSPRAMLTHLANLKT